METGILFTVPIIGDASNKTGFGSRRKLAQIH